MRQRRMAGRGTDQRFGGYGGELGGCFEDTLFAQFT
jgi:hypothetical protein